MAEYRHTYNCTRFLHARPFSEIAKIAKAIQETYPNITKTYVAAYQGGPPINAQSIMSLMVGFPETHPSKIEIIIEGEYQESILKECSMQLAEKFLKQEQDCE